MTKPKTMKFCGQTLKSVYSCDGYKAFRCGALKLAIGKMLSYETKTFSGVSQHFADVELIDLGRIIRATASTERRAIADAETLTFELFRTLGEAIGYEVE